MRPEFRRIPPQRNHSQTVCAYMRNKPCIWLTIMFLLSSCDKDLKENKIVGTWKLIEFSHLDSLTNEWQHPYGQHPKGYFTYTSNNIVHLNISNEHPLKLSADSLNATKFVYADFMNNAVGYFGEYEVCLKDAVITHKVIEHSQFKE